MNSPFLIYLRLELSDALRSKWLPFAASVYLALGAAFVWLGLRESSVLGFTGLSRVLLNVAHAVIVIFPLLVLVGSHGAVVRARSNGFCELMLTQPAQRTSWLLALLSARAVVLIGPLCLLMLASIALGDEAELASVALRCLSICAALVFCFIGLGLLISAVSGSVERALVAALMVFVLCAALQDALLIGTLLQSSLPPQLVFALAALNPSEAARVGVLSSVDPELSVLGPVGFWLANTLGPMRALQLAIAWPLALGSCAVLLAHRRLVRSDLVT